MDNLSISELGVLLEEQLRHLGPDHADTLMTRHVLAREIAFQGGFKQAIPLYQDLIQDREKALGPRHRDTLASRHNLALCHAESGNHEIAMAMYRALIPELEDSLGFDDPHTLQTRQELARTLSMAGFAEESIREFQQLLSEMSQSGRERRLQMSHVRNMLQEVVDNHGIHLRTEFVNESGDDPYDIEEPTTSDDRATVVELKLGRALAARAAEILDQSVAMVEASLARDAKIVSRRVIGHDDVAMGAAIFSSLGSEPDVRDEEGFLDIIRLLVASPAASASRVASQISLALVDVASTAASLDRAWEEHEEMSVDALRSELRHILGDRIDTTSDELLEFEKSFEGVVGLSSVRQQLLGFVAYILDRKKRSLRGGPEESPRLHLAFVGNPGTGKTSVARIYARLLHQLGLVATDSFIETDKAGLIAEHVGQTQDKTKRVIDHADPGVLFIDEAYALNDAYGSGKGYGEEALEVIIKDMEDRRGSLIVILAGYGKEIEELFKVNPGLRSRIAATIEFPDYSDDELEEIAVRYAAKRNLRLDSEAQGKMRSTLVAMKTLPDFGNARNVENLLEEAYRNQLMRLAPLGDLATETERRWITGADVPSIVSPQKKHIGYV